jgi:spermidine synthase
LKPTVQLAQTKTPDGQTMVLSQHGQDFYISLNKVQLMTSREHESELELARIGCEHLEKAAKSHVLIGGLGMGFTLRETLRLLGEQAEVTVAELIPDVIAWNRDLLGKINNNAMQDTRVIVKSHDVADIINQSSQTYDAILLDVDNGPTAITSPGNRQLYEPAGLAAIMEALKPEGCLAIWSVNEDAGFGRRLKKEGLQYQLIPVAAHKNSRAKSRHIWLITEGQKRRR